MFKFTFNISPHFICSPNQISLFSCSLSSVKHPRTKWKKKAESVFSFLENNGFNDAQVSILARNYPKFLKYSPEHTLLPKLEFFARIGFSGADRANFVMKNPSILGKSLEERIVPSYDLLRSIVKSEDTVFAAIKRYPAILGYEFKEFVERSGQIQVLVEEGVCESNIVLSLCSWPMGFKYLCRTHSAEHLSRIVLQVKELGFDPLRIKFVVAVQVLLSMFKADWDKKVEAFKEWGWSEDDVDVAFGKYPRYMMASGEKISEVFCYLVNEMGLKSTVLVSRPSIFLKGFRKRIVPRSLVYRVLLEKGLIEGKEDVGLITLLDLSENKFRDRIEMYKEQVPELLNLYKGNFCLEK